MNQPHIYIHPLLFGFPSHLGHHRALSRVHCAILWGLISYLFYTYQCIYIYIYIDQLQCSSSSSKMALVAKDLPASAGAEGDTGSIAGLRRSFGGANTSLLQYSCLGNPMDRGAWWATAHGVAKSQTLNNNKKEQICASFFFPLVSMS